ncbi:hypothetical protein BJ912DRAFT_926926 [Pholiota molesta]|nr:hypothetical protein BJ912DRAFT_926926 [Pholiota molesta]
MGILAVDDRDPSITYTGGWAQAASPNEFDNTSTFTAVAGSTAKVTFTGSSIGVYGSIPAKTPKGVAPVSAYSIDGGAPTLFRATEAGTTQFSQLFFQSPVLPEGAHTLTILYPVASDPFSLDYLLVLQNGVSTTTSTTSTGTGTATTTSSTTTSSSTTTTLPTTTSATTTSTSTTPPPLSTITVTSVAQSTTATSGADSTSGNASGTNSAASTNHTGAIVGGILGGVVVLFFIVFGIIIWRRKQRSKRSSMIASNYWNTETSTPPKPYASASPQMNNNIPIMAQTTGGSGSYPANPRYPGGYAPAPPPPQSQAYGGYAPAPAPYADRGYYTQGSDQGYHHGYADAGYSAGAYLPPSQILSQQAGNDYGRGR